LRPGGCGVVHACLYPQLGVCLCKGKMFTNEKKISKERLKVKIKAGYFRF
jgi:hypothetical protein